MLTGRHGRYRETLLILGRAAGLSSLALATLASGPCGRCTLNDDCATVDDLLATRTAGIADAGPISSAGSSSAAGTPALKRATAKTWGGITCPTPGQDPGIGQPKFPSRV